MNRLDLTGLKAHHPLGFLAACGLLRCLTESKDFGRVQLGWQIEDGKECFAVLYSESLLEIAAITRKLLGTADKQRNSSAWTWSDKIADKGDDNIDGRGKYRQMAQTVVQNLFEGATARNDADMAAALASDMILGNKGKSLQATAFDLTSGQQGLLKSFKGIADWSELKKANDTLEKTKIQGVERKVEEALIGPWLYQDEHHSLGWDPQGQRIHALRWKAPKKDTARRSVRMAVFLGSLALPLFPCFAVGNRLRTTGFHGRDNDDWFAWPIWREPISLDALRSLVSHVLNKDLKQRGVQAVYRCRVAPTGGTQGNYLVFGHPEERR